MQLKISPWYVFFMLFCTRPSSEPDLVGGAQEWGDIQRASRKLRQLHEHHTKRSISNKRRWR